MGAQTTPITDLPPSLGAPAVAGGPFRRVLRGALRGATETTDGLDFGHKLALLTGWVRWVAVGVGLLSGIVQDDPDVAFWVTAAVLAVFALAGTVRPIDLDLPDRRARQWVVVELLLAAGALAATGGTESPFALVPIVPVTIGAFLWGVRAAAGVAASAVVVMVLFIVNDSVSQGAQRAAAELGIVYLLCAALGAFARVIVQEVEQRHTAALDQMTRMATANDLLVSLHGIAQTLPASLDLAEVLESVRSRLHALFELTALTVFVRDEAVGTWRVELAEGVRLSPYLDTENLPSAVRQVAIEPGRPILVDDLLRSPLEPCSPLARSGLYAPLRARGNLVGLLAIEHSNPYRYETDRVDLLASLASLFALAIDNALWFSRLRRFGAEAERARIARELHDSIAQSLAYIAFELERLAEPGGDDPHQEELGALHEVVRGVVTDLRETLYQLRAKVTEDVDLATVAEHALARFEERTGIAVGWTPTIEHRFPHQIEQEVWRMLQEALTNVERHSGATKVNVTWTIAKRKARLEIVDNGCGFEPERVNGDHYGLLGMRERADSVGALLTVESEVGVGTRIVVVVQR